MRTNTGKVQKVDDLEPGDQIYSEHGNLYWIESIGEKQWVTVRTADDEEKRISHMAVEGCEIESRAPGGEGRPVENQNQGVMASELIAKLQQAIDEQGDCEVMFLMETKGGGYNPLTTFDLEVMDEAGGINLVGEDGTQVPQAQLEEKDK